MIVSDNQRRDFIEQFEKKFSSFCERAPVYLSYSISSDNLFLENKSTGNVMRFSLEDRPVGDIIFGIRKYLKSHEYPKVTQVITKFVEPSVSDLNAYMTENDCSFDDAFNVLSHKEVRKTYVIDKINLRQNQILLEDLDGEQYLYQMNMPVALFLKKISTGSMNSEESFTFLEKDSSFLYKIERRT